jgi:hypothetical protein
MTPPRARTSWLRACGIGLLVAATTAVPVSAAPLPPGVEAAIDLLMEEGPGTVPPNTMPPTPPVPAPVPPPAPPSGPGSGRPLALRTVAFPSAQQFVNSFVAKAKPQCFDFGLTLSLPGFAAFVPSEAPADDIVCDERGTLSTIFQPGGRVELITIPNKDPLINHLRFFSSLSLIGDCPERAPRWPGCFPLPELGVRAPVNLPPGAFFQPLPPEQDRMTVDRFLNMCRLHELIMPEPQAGDPQSLVRGRNELSGLGLFTTVGPEENVLRRLFTSAGDPTPICDAGAVLGLVVRELMDLGMDQAMAQSMANQATSMGARSEEIMEDLLRACDGKGDAATCSPVSLAGNRLGMDGICSSPMASIGACTAGDAGCAQRRVCLPGNQLVLSVRCASEPSLPECAPFRQLTATGLDPAVAGTLIDQAPETAQELLRALGTVPAGALQRVAGAVGSVLGSDCRGRIILAPCLAGAGSCIPTGVERDPICVPGTPGIAKVVRDALMMVDPCGGQGRDANGDGRCDACERAGGGIDANNDGICGVCESRSQADTDGDGVCDSGGATTCKPSDGPGFTQCNDNCLRVANSDQKDANQDGAGDACSTCPSVQQGDVDQDGTQDCFDVCSLPGGMSAPNPAIPDCGCTPAFGEAQGQAVRWPGVAGAPAHLDSLRCAAPGAAPTSGPFLLRDVTRQDRNATLTSHLHRGAMGSGFGPSAQEIVTLLVPAGGGRGSIVSSPTANLISADLRVQAAVDAHIYAQLYYDFLRSLGLSSFSDLPSLATMVSRVGEGPAPGNAAFTQDGFDFFVGYREPAPQVGVTRFQSVASDSVGHEWTHAFALFGSSGSRSKGTSLSTTEGGPTGTTNIGAVVEEFACDVMGSAFEAFAAPRVPGGKTPNLFIGEESTGNRGFLRSIQDPTRNNVPAPDHVQHVLFRNQCQGKGPMDRVPELCMGPFAKWAFLAAQGSPGFPSQAEQIAGGYGGFTPIQVRGIGFSAVSRVVFTALRSTWNADGTYRNYVDGILSAAAMAGLPAADIAEIRKAFMAVGLL